MDIFTVLSVPTRRTIIEMLAKRGSLTATDIYDKFDSSPPAISQHLKVLLGAQIVRVQRQGQHRIYSLNIEKMYEFEKWTHAITLVWNQKFDQLEKVLEAEQKKLLSNKK